MPHIEVKVLAFGRWAPLQRLLASLATQSTEGRFAYSVEVIDNSTSSPLSPEQIALVRDRFGADYFHLGAKNIARARNTAMARCAAPFLAFIDDDEEATPGWLLGLFDVMEKYDSDVAFGPSFPLFGEGNENWIARTDAFQPTLAEEGAAEGFVESTANCSLRMAPLRESRARFDENFGECGGSDYEFFLRLRRLNFRFSYAPRAEVREIMPAARTKLRWFLRRAFRCGGSRAAALSRIARKRYAQELVGAFSMLATTLKPGKATLGDRLWQLSFFSGFVFFSISGRVLTEYASSGKRFTRFRHERWSVWAILRYRYSWQRVIN